MTMTTHGEKLYAEAVIEGARLGIELAAWSSLSTEDKQTWEEMAFEKEEADREDGQKAVSSWKCHGPCFCTGRCMGLQPPNHNYRKESLV